MASLAFIKNIQDSCNSKCETLKQAIKDDIHESNSRKSFKSLNKYACLLPCLEAYHQEFIQKIETKTFLFDNNIKSILEESKCINWCPAASKLHALNVKGDGNCLVHAVSLFLWGIDDSDLILRNLIYEEIKADHLHAYKNRWKNCLSAELEESQILQFCSNERNNEWNNEVKLASCSQTEDVRDLPYHSLEDIHIFILANIIRRPIIALGEDSIRSFVGSSLAPNKLVGIYLPLLWKPEECIQTPVIIGYNQNHYVPLVVTAAERFLELSSEPRAIPLVKADLTPLLPHFLTYEEENNIDILFTKYFKIEELVFIKDGESHFISAAKLCEDSLPDRLNLMSSFFTANERIYRHFLESELLSSKENEKDKNKFSDEVEDDDSFTSLSIKTKINIKEKLQKFLVKKQPEFSCEEEHEDVFTAFGPISCNYLSCITKGCANFQSVYTSPYCHDCINLKSNMGTVLKSPLQRTYSEGSRNIIPQKEKTERLKEFQSKISDNEQKGKYIADTSYCEKFNIPTNKIKSISEEKLPYMKSTPCRITDCPFGAVSENNHYCSQCYKLNFEKPSLVSVEKASEGFPFSGINPVNDESSNISDKYFCLTEGCEGLRANNPLGLCYNCFKTNLEKTQKGSASQSRPKLQRRLSKCIFPCCSNSTFSESFVCQQCYNLCCLIMDSPAVPQNESQTVEKIFRLPSQVSPGLECFEPQRSRTLPRQYSHNNLNNEINNVNLKKESKCRNLFCSFNGNPDTLNYCSQCFYKYLEEQGKSSKRKPEIIYVKRKSVSDPPASFIFSKPLQNLPYSSTLNCIADAGCCNPGNPDMQGLCSSCYEKFLKLTMPKKDCPEFILDLIQDCVKQDTGKCLTSHCNNRGNKKCNGFCNNCSYRTFN